MGVAGSAPPCVGASRRADPRVSPPGPPSAPVPVSLPSEGRGLISPGMSGALTPSSPLCLRSSPSLSRELATRVQKRRDAGDLGGGGRSKMGAPLQRLHSSQVCSYVSKLLCTLYSLTFEETQNRNS